MSVAVMWRHSLGASTSLAPSASTAISALGRASEPLRAARGLSTLLGAPGRRQHRAEIVPERVRLPRSALNPARNNFVAGIAAAWRQLRLSEAPKGFGRFAGERRRNGDAEGVGGGSSASAETKEDGSSESSGEKHGHASLNSTGGNQGNKNSSSNNNNNNNNNNWARQLALWGVLLLGAAFLSSSGGVARKEISFHTFVWELLAAGKVEKLEVVDHSTVRVYVKGGTSAAAGDGVTAVSPPPVLPSSSPVATYYFNIGSVEAFERRLEQVQEDLALPPEEQVPVVYAGQGDGSVASELLRSAPTLLITLGLLWLMRGALGNIPGGGGRNLFQVGKANPTVVKGERLGKHVTFRDVAGLDEAKAEVVEFVDFLRNPKRYEALGAQIPRGALLVGPPGTGKTLLARATAGEAHVPFLSMSGSDFIEMFVGVGPSRVRDLFGQARTQAPCIVFIDEIDAVGRARGRGGFTGGNDERENTLNALLVEMDGFSSTSGVVVLAGTNRVDILDRALLRPGRFDRQISVDKPDVRGRFDIFKVHLRPLQLQGSLDDAAKRLATLTPGFVGADVANVCNEGALIAARRKADAVSVVDLEAAIDRVLGGLEKRNKVISFREREIIAHHEAGHAVAGWFLEHADPLLKVSIVPRGSAALGFSQYLPQDRRLMSREQLADFITVALGGRVAEELVFDSITNGAQDDLQRVTRTAYAEVTRYGFSRAVGMVFFTPDSERQELYRPYSEGTAEVIDREAKRLVDAGHKRCKELLADKLPQLRKLAGLLLEKETVREADLVGVLGPRPFKVAADYDSVVGAFERDRQQRTGHSRGGGGGDARGGAESGEPSPAAAATATTAPSTLNEARPR